MRKRTKKKKRSCALCKPHKMKGCDKRSVKDIRRDEGDKLDYGYVN